MFKSVYTFQFLWFSSVSTWQIKGPTQTNGLPLLFSESKGVWIVTVGNGKIASFLFASLFHACAVKERIHANIKDCVNVKCLDL